MIAAEPTTLRAGQWAGDEVWVVGSGPSRELVDLPELDARSQRGEVRIIAVNHAVHDVPHADIVYSKHTDLYREEPGKQACCVGISERDDILCVLSLGIRYEPMSEWRGRYPDLLVLREWPREAAGACGPWPDRIDDSDKGALVTCGNSGIGAVCLADMLAFGDPRSTVHVVGLDLDRVPYATWGRWFHEGGYAGSTRTRIVVHGDTTMDPTGVWGRA